MEAYLCVPMSGGVVLSLFAAVSSVILSRVRSIQCQNNRKCILLSLKLDGDGDWRWRLEMEIGDGYWRWK